MKRVVELIQQRKQLESASNEIKTDKGSVQQNSDEKMDIASLSQEELEEQRSITITHSFKGGSLIQ